MASDFNPLQDAAALCRWYDLQKRDLPWRRDRDPYRIWVSEVMLQQTTVVAVIPFYERFMLRFPTLESLASSPIEDVLTHWARLGYYSRARNLHKAAQALRGQGFPRTFERLLELPGFGPYTARAVASLAFGQKTGVLDGNVIRVLSRRLGLREEWWKPNGRERLQKIADALAQCEDPSALNQGLMELGATVCTPARPACLLCPWAKSCVARRADLIDELPLKKPRRDREIWVWNAHVVAKRGKVALVKNDYAPFLKGHWIYPGSAKRQSEAPKKFAYRHSVTHHDIFVVIRDAKSINLDALAAEVKWIPRGDIAKWVPASLVTKALRLNE